jgi:DNA gyrase subunit A
MKTREEDFVAQLIVDSTHAFLLCFTNTGRVYWLKVYEIPDVGAAGKGKSMQSLLNLQPGENVRHHPARARPRGRGQVHLLRHAQRHRQEDSAQGLLQRHGRGIIAIAIDKDDDLITARITDGKQTIFLATRDGMAIRFEELYDPDAQRNPACVPWAATPPATRASRSRRAIRSSASPSPTRMRRGTESRRVRRGSLGLTAKLVNLRSAAYAEAKEALQKAREERRNGGLPTTSN